MSYRALTNSLWPVTDAVARYLKEHRGLNAIKIEEEIAPDVPRPTLHAKTPDQAFLCVEVLEETCFNANIERLVTKCKVNQLPVRLYVAVPESALGATFSHDFRAAKQQCVGVMSVSESGTIQVLSEPLSLLLADVRKINSKEFPSKYKADLALAEQTYLQGNPVKGCAAVYDIIEALVRRVAKKLYKKGCVGAWSNSCPDFEKVAWLRLPMMFIRHWISTRCRVRPGQCGRKSLHSLRRETKLVMSLKA